LDVVVPALYIGAMVESLPYGYTVVRAGGVPYYYYDGWYYRPCPEGYMVVNRPVIVDNTTAAPAPLLATPIPVASDEGKAVTIRVPNNKGGFTPVTLTKHNNGYIGPEGEFYEGNPSVEKLKALYGNKEATIADVNTVTIKIPNADGSFSSVTLTKYKKGYLGPQGEYYEGHPSVDELKALYGK
jgi:hypothetical protein